MVKLTFQYDPVTGLRKRRGINMENNDEPQDIMKQAEELD